VSITVWKEEVEGVRGEEGKGEVRGEKGTAEERRGTTIYTIMASLSEGISNITGQ